MLKEIVQLQIQIQRKMKTKKIYQAKTNNNKSATVTIPVASGTRADLSVTNSSSPNPVTAGNNITYTQSRPVWAKISDRGTLRNAFSIMPLVRASR